MMMTLLFSRVKNSTNDLRVILLWIPVLVGAELIDADSKRLVHGAGTAQRLTD